MLINDPTVPEATEADLVAGNRMLLQTPTGTKQLPAELIVGKEKFETISVYYDTDISDATLTDKGLNSSGVESAVTFLSLSKYIQVKKGDEVYYCLNGFTNYLILATYDTSKTFVDGVASTNAKQEGKKVIEQDGFIRFSTRTSSLSSSSYYIVLNANNRIIEKTIQTAEDLSHYLTYDNTTISSATLTDKGINSSGAETAITFMSCSDYIVVKKNDVVSFSLNSFVTSLAVAFYDTSKTFVEGVTGTNTRQKGTYVCPNDGFVRFSTKTSSISNSSYYFGISKGDEFLFVMRGDVDELTSYAGVTTPIPTDTITGAGFSNNGAVSTSSFWANYSIAKFELSLGETLEASFNSVTGDSNHPVVCERFHDGSLQKMLAFDGDYRTSIFSHTATKLKEFIWINYATTNGLKVSVKPYFDKMKGTSLLETSLNYITMLKARYATAICIGDSLTYGQQTSVQGVGVSKDNYPRFLQRMTGMNVTNAGQSGVTTKQWLDNIAPSYNFADYECAFICLGTNGDILDDETDENYIAYCDIIDLIKTQNPNCAIFIIDALNTHVNDALAHISSDYGLPFIRAFENDLYWLRGNHGSAVSPTHYRQGDSVHLSPMGYLLLARNILVGMCADMSVNTGNYNQELST